MKVSIIGAGCVGAAVATAIQNTGLFREIVLFDRNLARSRAVAEDLGHAGTFAFDVSVRAANNYSAIKNSEIVIIAAGKNHKLDECRTDLLASNKEVLEDIIPQVMAQVDKNKVKLIILTNPLDVMVMLAVKLSKLPSSRVLGTGTMLDTARFKNILSRTLGVSNQSISADVLGEHGLSAVLNWSGATVGGLPLAEFEKQSGKILNASAKQTIEDRVKGAANEIIKGRGATWDGISAAAANLCRAILMDENKILTVSTLSVVGKSTVAFSVPTIVGKNGAKMVLKPKLNDAESKELTKSKNIIRKNFEKLK